MTRKQQLTKIRRWLRVNGLTASDIGVEGPLNIAPDGVLASILDDIAEDEARKEGARLEELESLDAMLEEES